jgi:hypothetical protein
VSSGGSANNDSIDFMQHCIDGIDSVLAFVLLGNHSSAFLVDVIDSQQSSVGVRQDGVSTNTAHSTNAEESKVNGTRRFGGEGRDGVLGQLLVLDFNLFDARVLASHAQLGVVDDIVGVNTSLLGVMSNLDQVIQLVEIAFFITLGERIDGQVIDLAVLSMPSDSTALRVVGNHETSSTQNLSTLVISVSSSTAVLDQAQAAAGKLEHNDGSVIDALALEHRQVLRSTSPNFLGFFVDQPSGHINIVSAEIFEESSYFTVRSWGKRQQIFLGSLPAESKNSEGGAG